jgi:4-amino-4-deoxy-L-arabinose transferase-like glycosyltransferase
MAPRSLEMTQGALALPESRTARIAAFVVPALVTAVVAVSLWQGFQATDDLRYAQLAASVLQDTAPDASVPLHQRARVGLYYPLAAVFWLCGTGVGSLALLPLLCTVLTAPLLVALARHFYGPREAWAAGLLFAVVPTTVQYATMLLPEPIVTFELSLAAVLFCVTTRGGSHLALRALLAGTLIGVAYLTSESGALMLPILWIHGWVTRGEGRRWLMVGGFAAVVAAECVGYAVATGNPLYRHLELGAEYSADPMLMSAGGDWLYRLVRAYPDRLLRPSATLGVSGWLMIAAGIWGLSRTNRSSLLVIWAGTVFLFFNFMPVSLSPPLLLPVSSRLLVPGCAPLWVLAGAMAVDLWDRLADSRLRAGFAALAASFVVTCLAATFLITNTRYTAVLARNAELVSEYLQSEVPLVLISDTTSAASIDFLRGFDPHDQVMNFDAGALWLSEPVVAQSLAGDPFFVLLNGPAVHEQQISGGLYGGNLSLTASDRAWIATFVPTGTAPGFSAQYRRGPLFDRWFALSWVRSLFENPAAIERRFALEPAWASARLLRLTELRSGGAPQAEGQIP